MFLEIEPAARTQRSPAAPRHCRPLARCEHLKDQRPGLLQGTGGVRAPIEECFIDLGAIGASVLPIFLDFL